MPIQFKFIRSAIVISVFLLAMSSPQPARAQSKDVAAPIPVQIAAAKKVFIANAGTDVNPYGPFSEYNGGPTHTYNEFYAAMKTWGRYELVSGPADADLVFEIRFTDPAGPPSVSSSKNIATYGAQQIRVVIVDAKTHFKLWALNEFMPGAILQGNRDKNFERAMDSLISDVKSLVP